MTKDTNRDDAGSDEEIPPIEPRSDDSASEEAESSNPDRPDILESGSGPASRRPSVLGRLIASVIFLAIAVFAVLEVRAGRSSLSYRLYRQVLQKHQAKAVWTPEQIVKDPEGYLLYAADTVKSQTKERQDQLTRISQRKVEIDQKASTLSTKVADIGNIRDRLQSAAQRADDEDRWPIKVGTRTFDKETAQAFIASAEKYVTDRKPLVSAYDEARRRMAGTESALKTEIERLDQLGEKVALDLERVRLNKGMAALEELKQTEAALASFSSTIADVSEDPSTLLSLPPPSTGKGQVDVEQLLK